MPIPVKRLTPGPWFVTLGFTLASMTAVWATQTMFAQGPAPTVSGDWLIDIRTVAAVGGVVLLGTWRVARWMRQIDDRLASGETRFDKIEENMSQRDGLLRTIQGQLDRLPCHGDCPDRQKRK